MGKGSSPGRNKKKKEQKARRNKKKKEQKARDDDLGDFSVVSNRQKYQPVLKRMIDQEKNENDRKDMEAVLKYCSGEGLPDHLTPADCKKQLCKWRTDRLPTPPAVEDVQLKREDGKLIATWTGLNWPFPLTYCLLILCTQSMGSEQDKTEFHDIKETSCELSNVSPIKYYKVTVWPVDTKGRKGEKKQSEEGRLCELHGNIYLNVTSPLPGSSKFYNGYIEHAFCDPDPVAVKVVEMAKNRNEDGHKNEVNILLKLKGSSNIVTFCSAPKITGTHGGSYCIAMELCHTETGRFMHAKHNMQWYKMVIIHIMSGVADIHEAGYVHGDLKLQNILLSLDCKKIKIAGFGKSRKIDPTKSEDTKGDISDVAYLIIRVLSYSTHVCNHGACDWKPSIINGRDVYSSMLTFDFVEIAKNMISKMLQGVPSKRPTAIEVVVHPFFWDDEKKLNFLHYMSLFFTPVFLDKITCELLTKIVMKDLNEKKSIFRTKNGDANWVEKMEETLGVSFRYRHVSSSYRHVLLTARGEVFPWITYDHTSVFDLIRFIRNVEEHYTDVNYWKAFGNMKCNVWKFFYNCFPTLLCTIYNAVYEHFPQIKNCREFPNDAAKFFTEPAHYEPLPVKEQSKSS